MHNTVLTLGLGPRSIIMTQLGVHVKCILLLFDLQQNWNVVKIFSIIHSVLQLDRQAGNQTR